MSPEFAPHHPGPEAARGWLAEHRIRVLNVAGPRESKRAGMYEGVRGYLAGVLALASAGLCGRDSEFGQEIERE